MSVFLYAIMLAKCLSVDKTMYKVYVAVVNGAGQGEWQETDVSTEGVCEEETDAIISTEGVGEEGTDVVVSTEGISESIHFSTKQL